MASPKVFTNNGSSPNDSLPGKPWSKPKSKTGEKSNGIEDALVS